MQKRLEVSCLVRALLLVLLLLQALMLVLLVLLLVLLALAPEPLLALVTLQTLMLRHAFRSVGKESSRCPEASFACSAGTSS